MKKDEPIKGKHGYEMCVTKTLAEARPDDYRILALPGGASTETARKNPKTVEVVKDFFMKDKPVAAICHGPQTPIAAGC